MAISFVAKSAFASGTAGLTVGAVSGTQADDLILLFVESANQAVTTPSGYTAVSGAQITAGTAAAAGGMLLNVFYKWATGADSSTTVADTGDHTTAIKLAYRGVDTTTPFDATPTTGTKTTASTSSSYPSITTATANALVVYASALDLDSASTATTSAQANANLTSLTERHDQTVASGFGGGIVITDGFKASAGASGAMTATVTSTQQVYVTLALRPQGPKTHDTTGALVGQGSTLAGISGHAKAGFPILLRSDALAIGYSASPGAQSVNVPADAQLVVVHHRLYNAAGSALSLSSSFAGTFTINQQAAGSGESAGVSYALVNSTGAQTITPSWTNAPTEGPHFVVSFIAGINTSDFLRDSDLQLNETIASAITLTTGSTDLVLAHDSQFDSGEAVPGNQSGYTSILTYADNNEGSRLRIADSPGASTTTVTGQTTSYNAVAGLAIKPGASGPVTHATTGALVGSGSTVTGSADHKLLHTTTGALTGQGSTVTGSANRFRAHDTTGDIVGPGSTITGAAARSSGSVTHDTSGALVGAGSTVAGAANRFRAFSSTGALVGQGSVLAGVGARWRAFGTSGALVGQGSTITGSATRFRSHATSGALVGSGSTIAGAAQHNIPHGSSGALVGQGSEIVGAAQRNSTVVTHDTSGALVGQPGGVAGAATRFRAFSSSGVLVGPGSTLSGAAARSHLHDTSGSLVGAGASVSGSATRNTTHGTSGALVGSGAVITGSATNGTAAPPTTGDGGGWRLRAAPDLPIRPDRPKKRAPLTVEAIFGVHERGSKQDQENALATPQRAPQDHSGDVTDMVARIAHATPVSLPPQPDIGEAIRRNANNLARLEGERARSAERMAAEQQAAEQQAAEADRQRQMAALLMLMMDM